MNKDTTDKNDKEQRKSQQAIERENRLKEALRVNLHRRKGQARARQSDDTPTEAK